MCGGNGRWYPGCTCAPCYTGRTCKRVVPSFCNGTLRLVDNPNYSFLNYEKCQCDYNQAGRCCEKKKCAGSNPTPDPETGECDCADPELRSGEFCENVTCNHGNATRDGTCDCTGFHFTGEYCQEIKCLNGGNSYANATKCHCNQEGRFYGTHCEHLDCNGGTPVYPQLKCEDCGILHKGDYCHKIHAVNLSFLLIPLVCVVFCILYCIILRCFERHTQRELKAASDELGTQDAETDRGLRITATSFLNPTSTHRGSAESSLATRPDQQPERRIRNISNNVKTQRNNPNANEQAASSPSDPFLNARVPTYPRSVGISRTTENRPLAYDDDPPPYDLVVQINEGDDGV